MTQELIIVGASGLAKEVFWLADRAEKSVMGFLDDAIYDLGGEFCSLPLLGSIDDAGKFSGAEFAMAIGSPRSRKLVVQRMQENGIENFATLVDPMANIGPRVEVGKGSIICAGSMATIDIEIGPFALLDRGAVIGHDSMIGAFNTIAPLASVSGNVTTGEIVEIGTNASIKQGLSLARGSMLGMGSVLLRNLEENEIAVGNPAKTLRFVE